MPLFLLICKAGGGHFHLKHGRGRRRTWRLTPSRLPVAPCLWSSSTRNSESPLFQKCLEIHPLSHINNYCARNPFNRRSGPTTNPNSAPTSLAFFLGNLHEILESIESYGFLNCEGFRSQVLETQSSSSVSFHMALHFSGPCPGAYTVGM